MPVRFYFNNCILYGPLDENGILATHRWSPSWSALWRSWAITNGSKQTVSIFITPTLLANSITLWNMFCLSLPGVVLLLHLVVCSGTLFLVCRQIWMSSAKSASNYSMDENCDWSIRFQIGSSVLHLKLRREFFGLIFTLWRISVPCISEKK